MTKDKSQPDNQVNIQTSRYKITLYNTNSPLFRIICRWFNEYFGDSSKNYNAIGELTLIIEKWLYAEGYNEYFGEERSDDYE